MNDSGNDVGGLLTFLDGSPTAAWAVRNVTEALEGKGFGRIEESAAWNLGTGERFYVVRSDSSVIAGITGTGDHAVEGFRIVGAHTDFPGFRVKPDAERTRDGMTTLGVEVYGGPILASWFDRDLAFAGTLIEKSEGVLKRRLFTLPEPLCRISTPAIHLNREMNEAFKVDPEEHTHLLLSSSGLGLDKLLEMACGSAGIERNAVAGWSLEVWDPQPASLTGIGREFVCSGRIDNLAMCHSSLDALLAQEPAPHTSLIALFDSEEVGSATVNGAASTFLGAVMERISGGREELFRAVAGSIFVSADGAHAVHPNFSGKHDPGCRPVINGGPVVKINAKERYSSSDLSTAYIRTCADAAEVTLQSFVSRNDIPCGSTIGSITAARTGLPGVDIGSPMLSMHSAREMAGAMDHAAMTTLLVEHLKGTVPVPR